MLGGTNSSKMAHLLSEILSLFSVWGVLAQFVPPFGHTHSFLHLFDLLESIFIVGSSDPSYPPCGHQTSCTSGATLRGYFAQARKHNV